jgi:hypothetical protein
VVNQIATTTVGCQWLIASQPKPTILVYEISSKIALPSPTNHSQPTTPTKINHQPSQPTMVSNQTNHG